MTAIALQACRDLVTQLYPGEPVLEPFPVAFTGEEIGLSRHAIGSAAAAALGAYACGISRLWEQRSGVRQGACIDVHRATVPGLRTSSHLSQNGHRLHYGRPPHESANFFETRDGRRMYLLRISQYAPLVFGLLKLMGCSNDTAELARATARWDSSELEEALAFRKLLGGIARTREEWLAHPQGNWLAAQPPVSVTRIGDGPAMPQVSRERPLDGVRVLDMAHVLAGPVAARTLAEQGADVLHATAPLAGEDFRVVMDTGLGKRNAFIDLNEAEGVACARELLSRADVFVQSFRPGSLDRKGFSPDDLARLRPGLIYTSVSAYGTAGPWRERGGLDPLGQAVTGLAIAEGSADAPVLAPTMTLNDYLAGYLAAAGVVAALVRRAREGGSYHVEVSLARCSMWLQDLGRLPEGQWPSGPQPSPEQLEARAADMMDTESPFGRLRHARPVVDFEATPSRWERGPSPLGSGWPVWRERG